MKYGALLASLLFWGCASVSGTRDAPLEDGEFRLYRASVTEAREAAEAALIEVGLEIDSTEEVEPGTVMVVAQRGRSLIGTGQIVRIVVSTESDAVSRVRILTRRRAAVNVTEESDYSDRIFEMMAAELGSALGPY